MSFQIAVIDSGGFAGGSARMHFLRMLLLGFIVVLPQGASAQQQDIFRLFDGVIRSGIAAATQADWERLPTSEVACVDGVLRQRGSSVNEMIRQGVSPSDPRLARLRGGCRNQANAGPSFDCRRARSADEITICGDPELARLDRLVGEGYRDLLSTIGEGRARSLAAPLLATRRACGTDAGCIKSAQLSTIRALQDQGAAIANPEPAPAQSVAVDSPMPETPYVVEGLRLGGHVAMGTPAYLAYRCTPSEQFTGLTWCQRQRQEMAPRGAYSSTTTVLHSADGTALYVNRYLQPAFFAGSEAMDDVRRLAAKYGEPRYVAAPGLPNTPRTLMATWGGVVLQPLDRARLADLVAGREVRAGILIDHIGNFQRSASMELPVYRVTGGPGYVWAASWDQAGVGSLRFLTIDPSRLGPNLPDSRHDVASSAAPTQNTQAAESSLAAGPSANSVAPPSAKPTEPPVAAVAAPSATLEASRPTQASDSAAGTKTPAPPTPPTPVNSASAPSVSASAPSTQPPPAASQGPAATTRVAEANPPAPATPTVADRPPRVVGPPIAIQPAAEAATTGNTMQWALVAAIVVLLGAIGFLLVERRKRAGLVSSPPIPAIAKASMVAEDAAAKAGATEIADVKIGIPEEPKLEPVLMQEPPPVPALADTPSSSSEGNPAATSPAAMPGSTLKSEHSVPSSSIAEHRHFGIGLLAAVVVVAALMTPAIGIGGLLPLALAVYLLPTIIAFKVRHHYAGWLAAINVVFGATVLGWLGIFVWALTGPRRSALDAMGQPSTLGLSKTATSDPALQMSDYDLRSGWKMPVVQAEIFSFSDEGASVESGDALKVFFKNPVIGIWKTVPGPFNSVRYNALTQLRCVALIGSETKLRVGRTIGRTALTGIGAAILTGRSNALGAAFLDYRFGGDEKHEVVAALIVFSDYSSVVIQSESEEFEKFCALLPAHVLSEEQAGKTAEEIDRIKRMADDGPRVLEEMQAQIAKTKESIATFAAQAESGTTFAERDEGRTGLAEAEARLIDELAVLNAVSRLIKLAASRGLPDRRIA